MELLDAAAVGTLFGVGIFLVLRRNVIRSAIGLMLLANAINLFLLSAGAYAGEVPAYGGLDGSRSDALPQAFVLTAIVISMGGLALRAGHALWCSRPATTQATWTTSSETRG